MRKKELSKWICIFLLIIIIIGENYKTVIADEIANLNLYALSACLMDGDNGRILYGKDENEIRAMASTTKIMTCILALEYGNLEDMVKVSKYAASMPKVKLYAKENEYYKLKDLLYSLMLESHNDVAVAIAEHIGGSVENFAIMMNTKAKEIGCFDTFFITPNGLDATKNVNGEEKMHSTTAFDLCKIMAYCIKNEEFLNITNTSSYSFSNYILNNDNEYVIGGRNHSIANTNAFLTMMDGVVSGKTGFTGKAGYCYVAAVNKDGKNLIISLLGCGWPNNKTYKWSDSKQLFKYGLDNYVKETVNDMNIEIPIIYINNGVKGSKRGKVITMPQVVHNDIEMLLSEKDKVTYIINIPQEINAPVKNNTHIGEIIFYVNNIEIGRDEIYLVDDIEEYNYKWCLNRILDYFF